MMIVTTMMVVSAVGCLTVGLGAGVAIERWQARHVEDVARALPAPVEIDLPAPRPAPVAAPARARQARQRAAAG